ncbi:MAG: hypothetical protein HY689_12185 [Chloroflexi bacterium]|nr:hypothetical protein [Chloroflexota bacterium]
MRQRQRLRIVLAVIMALVAVVGSVLVVRPATRPVAFSDRLHVGGQPYFWAGVNYPWKSYQDFGTGAWGYSGVAEPTSAAEIGADFANLAASGVRVVKWRVFNDGRYSPEFDARGRVVGLDDRFLADLGAALEMARRHDIYLVFTLFDSGFWTTDCAQGGVQLGGHADSLRHWAKRYALLNRAVVPMLRHIGQHPAGDRVLAFEIISEPEWGIVELHAEEDGRVKVPLADVRAFVKEVAQAIHRHTSALATVEANRAAHMVHWRGLGLDYYSFSWYDWVEPFEPLDRPATAFGLDRPVVLGEFPSQGSAYYSLAQIYDIAYRQGYAGAFAWSYGGGDQFGRWDQVVDDFVRWVNGRWESVKLAGQGAAPTAPVALQPPPYQFQNVQVVDEEDGRWLQADVHVKQPGTYRLQWFLHEAASAPVDASTELTLPFSERVRRLRIQLGDLTEGRPYKVSLGIFDEGYTLLKWFEGLAVLKAEDGTVRLQEKVLEDPCGRRAELDGEAPGHTS